MDTGNFRGHLRDMALLVIKKSTPSDKILMPSFTSNYQEIKQMYFEKNGFSVSSERLKGSRWDPHFYNPRFEKINKKLKNKEVKKLEEIAIVLSGVMIPSDVGIETGKYLIIKPSHIQKNELHLFTENKYLDACSQRDSERILKPGDMITPLVNNSGEFYIYRESDPPAIANHNIAIIRSNDNEYIKSYLNTKDGNTLFSLQVDRKSRRLQNTRILTIRDIKNIRIPLLPIENLNKVSDKGIENATQTELIELKEKLAILTDKYKQEKSRNRESNQLEDLANNRYEKILLELRKMNQAVVEVNEQVQYLINIVSNIENDIQQIKQEGKGDLETIQSMIKNIDNNVNKITLETFDRYVEKTKEWLVPNWDKLHELSKRMLPSADMLFDNINRSETADPSPYILQYCRSLENELRIKIFVAYLHDLQLRKSILKNNSHGIWN
ncbi:restriction endonuclease subunit S [Anaerobacillus sp. CMMVII]|uniref:restriction endonuclease subunit S n=1 Tax=Anaerobacillus sp. CMMVII TaxID=2755588 RepID=UPI0021B7D9A3|nr:hypothetical protein [Anaerobacillus sp. CMMVII]MCT8140499.1 restriction endonuclease subunit S [Anaerobacillus sp. CMMVII]